MTKQEFCRELAELDRQALEFYTREQISAALMVARKTYYKWVMGEGAPIKMICVLHVLRNLVANPPPAQNASQRCADLATAREGWHKSDCDVDTARVRIAELEANLHATEQARDQYTDWHMVARREANERRDRIAKAATVLLQAIEYAGNRWGEWGSRGEGVHERIESALEALKGETS